MKKNGLVHIYCGDGKGKTTCAMGLCCRAAGAGLRVMIYQFMKDGRGHERKVLESFPNVSYESEPRSVCFSFQMSEAMKKEERSRYLAQMQQVFERVQNQQADVLVLDEVLYAISCGLFPEEMLTDFLDHRPDGLEVILTGREASKEVLNRADYVSRIVKEKHPYDEGIAAREGIEL